MPRKTLITIGKNNSNTREQDNTKRAKKHYNIEDIDTELGNIKNYGGVYILTPYTNLDDSGRGVFKIGMSLNLKNRCDNYLTYFPTIFFHSFIVGFNDSEYKKFKKDNPNITDDDINNNKVRNLKLFRAIEKVEKELIQKIFKRDKKSRRLQFTQREVFSEWIYTKSKYIDDIALELVQEYSLEYKGYSDNFNETITEYYQETLPEIIYCGKVSFN